MVIHQSAEDYLKTILILRERSGLVRSIDIVNELRFTRPGVSAAMKKLRENGYILTDRDGYITLTEKGQAVAGRIYERHKVLTSVLTAIGVDEETAAACKIEHDLSDRAFAKIKEYIENTEISTASERIKRGDNCKITIPTVCGKPVLYKLLRAYRRY